MALDIGQRHTLIALLCRVAWADGHVADAERALLREVMVRIGHGAVLPEELERWLSEGPPRLAPVALPAEAKSLFLEEAMRLIAVDRDVDPAEMKVLRDLINYYFTKLDEMWVG